MVAFLEKVWRWLMEMGRTERGSREDIDEPKRLS
jgi:hypothetical protein